MKQDPSPGTLAGLVGAGVATGVLAGAVLGWLPGMYVGMATPFAVAAGWAGRQIRSDRVFVLAAVALAIPAAAMIAVAVSLA